MAYNSKYTGAQVDALLDRAGEAPQTYDIGWLIDLLPKSTGAVTITKERFDEVKAAYDAGRMFVAKGGPLKAEYDEGEEDDTVVDRWIDLSGFFGCDYDSVKYWDNPAIAKFTIHHDVSADTYGGTFYYRHLAEAEDVAKRFLDISTLCTKVYNHCNGTMTIAETGIDSTVFEELKTAIENHYYIPGMIWSTVDDTDIRMKAALEFGPVGDSCYRYIDFQLSVNSDDSILITVYEVYSIDGYIQDIIDSNTLPEITLRQKVAHIFTDIFDNSDTIIVSLPTDSPNVNYGSYTLFESELIFTTGDTAPTVSWPDTLRWPGGEVMAIEANTTYEFHVLGYYGGNFNIVGNAFKAAES